ncbi:MAG: hypothetical protein JOS17DRAFT_560334 [Linnemannia elongata]|nr:MAG: hypothetical protein JOS17DRAFT_560334 [Linnemannia elongata]
MLTILLLYVVTFLDAWDGDDDLFKSLNIGNSNTANGRPLSSSLKPASSTSMTGTPSQPLSSAAATAGSGFVRKEEKMAEMARKREERRLRMAEAKEKKSQTTLGAKKI